MKRLENKVAIITGSNKDIGKGVVIAFAKEG
jgi:NAD(P)-dependent dehydrogenase (short-subunit alcohol dehydrogenase family)